MGNPDSWWVAVKHSELPEALQRRDAGMRGRALTTITEKSWRESCSGMSKFSEIMSFIAGKLGRNLVETRRELYNQAFGQSYADRSALGRPLQRVSELFREYVRVHSMLTIHEYIAYQCLQFLERQAIPAERGNTACTEALNRVVRGVIQALEAEEDPSTLVEKMCESLDKEDRLLASREVPTGGPGGPAAKIADEEATPKAPAKLPTTGAPVLTEKMKAAAAARASRPTKELMICPIATTRDRFDRLTSRLRGPSDPSMNVAAAPFDPKRSKKLAAARLLVSSIQAELEAAKATLTELEFAENCQPCQP